jgi:hypothetical protein
MDMILLIVLVHWSVIQQTSENAVAEFFSSEAEQVNCEMHQVNSCMKYGYGSLENTRSSIVSYANGQKLKLKNGKFKRSTEIVTPGGPFPEGNELVKKLTAIATYFITRSDWNFRRKFKIITMYQWSLHPILEQIVYQVCTSS